MNHISSVLEARTLNDAGDLLVLNLQKLMQKEGLSEAELARRTGIPQPTLHKILAGRTEDPRISTLQALSGYFSISVDALFSEVLDSRGHMIKIVDTQSVPVISWEECVRPSFSIKSLSPSNHSEWITISGSSIDTYALMSRPSLEPRFPKGTFFIVAPGISAMDGDLIVAHYPGTSEATLRELLVDGPDRFLVSVNQNVAPLPMTDEIKIIATVLQSRFEYR